MDAAGRGGFGSAEHVRWDFADHVDWDCAEQAVCFIKQPAGSVQPVCTVNSLFVVFSLSIFV